jgi:hypothetical protein
VAADIKKCAHCGTDFTKRRGDSATQWAARRFCSRACVSAARRSPSEAKTCEHCGSTFERPVARTDAHWASRRYCGRPCAFAARRTDEEARFWARVDRRGRDECWPWIGRTQGRANHETSTRGRFGETPTYAYRLAYEVAVGPVPDGMHVHHTCENPNCVNPAHLEPVTPSEHVEMHKAGVPRPQSVREAISRGHRASQRSKAAAAARRGVPRSPEVRQKISEGRRRTRGLA